MRVHPGDDYFGGDWGDFCEWADEHGIGEDTEDWMPWWECWYAGYASAYANMP